MGTIWDKRKAVERMQTYIEQHLERPVSMHELARAASYSMYYAARIFKEITGQSPFEYLRKRRLSAAANRLNENPSRIIDVAFDFVFDSHEGFTRAFARQFGVPPSRMQHINWSAFRYLPEPATAFYRRRQKGQRTMCEPEVKTSEKKKEVVFVQIVERPERKVIFRPGKKAEHYFEYCEEVGCDVYEVLGRIQPSLHEPMGLWWDDENRPHGSSLYVQGVEVAMDYSGDIPAGYEVVTLPACAMLVFQGPPFNDRDFEDAIVSIWDVINGYDPVQIGYEWAPEDGPRFQLAPMGYRGYIEGKPVRKRPL